MHKYLECLDFVKKNKKNNNNNILTLDMLEVLVCQLKRLKKSIYKAWDNSTNNKNLVLLTLP